MADVGDKQLAKTLAFFDGVEGVKLPHDLEVREKSEGGYRWLGIFKNGELFGWTKLKPTEVAEQQVHGVELVYVLPRYRKTVAAGWLFLYAKDLVGTPIVLGDDETYGGVAFKDGDELLRALQKTGKFELSLVDLKTGEKTPLEFPLKDNRFTTVMIESMVDLQLVARVAEGHSAPGEEKVDYQAKIAWLDDIE
jgi:hypothetical protein